MLGGGGGGRGGGGTVVLSLKETVDFLPRINKRVAAFSVALAWEGFHCGP